MEDKKIMASQTLILYTLRENLLFKKGCTKEFMLSKTEENKLNKNRIFIVLLSLFIFILFLISSLYYEKNRESEIVECGSYRLFNGQVCYYS